MEDLERFFNNSRNIIKTASRALKYGLCDRCLGRLFGRAGYGLENHERGKAVRIMLAISYELLSDQQADVRVPFSSQLPIHPSKQEEPTVTEGSPPDEGWQSTGTPSMMTYLEEGSEGHKCWLCHDVFDTTPELAHSCLEASRSHEFTSFLVGCRMDPGTLERERSLWEISGPSSAESLKEELNREIGKAYSEIDPPKNFDKNNPEITFLVDPLFKNVEISIKPVFIRGRYRKLIRGIPQTRWVCKNCRGKGCLKCHGKGRMYETSVEEIIGAPVMDTLKGLDFKLHGMGREDIDVLTLGSGRPFILEITYPMKRSLDLGSITERINDNGSGKVEVLDLVPSSRKEVPEIKDGATLKRYRARIIIKGDVDEETLKYNISLLAQSPINQRTPWRVSHRRADKVRVRKVHEVFVSIDESGGIVVDLLTDGGLYIKELLNGDEGRTDPSLSSLLGLEVNVETLDVMDVLDDERSLRTGGEQDG